MRMKCFFLCLCLALSACSAFNRGGGAGASVDETSYPSEFSDIFIPREMKAVDKQTAIIHNQDGTRAGTQVFEGRVDLQSLVSAMLYNMSQRGWIPRSVFRGQSSAMVFEKENNVALITAAEGVYHTTMNLWVAKKINEGAFQYGENPSSFLPPVIEGNPL